MVPSFGTPLAAAVRSDHAEIVKYLVEHGADVDLASPWPAPWDGIRGKGSLAPLQFAVNGGHTPIVAYLQSVGAKM